MTIQIRGGQIKSASISGSQLASGAINNSNLFSAGVVTSSALAASSVTSSAIASGAIDNATMFANSVITAAKINLTGSFDFTSGTLKAGTPSNTTDVANKAYVDSIQAGIHWKESVIAATTANIDISSAPTSIDGVTLSSSNEDRILVKNQSTASSNGIYQYNGAGSALTRTNDADVASEFNGLAVFVQKGSTQSDMGYIQTAQINTLGSDSIQFTQFTGLGQITAGDGLEKSANTLSIDLSSNAGLTFASGELEINEGNGLELASNALQVKLNGSTLAVDSSGLKVGTITSSELGANSVTSAAIASAAINSADMLDSSVVTSEKIAANAVSEAKIAAGAVSLGKLASDSVDESKIASSVAGSGLTGGGGSALAVSVDDSSIEIASDSIKVKSAGIVAAMLAASSVETGKINDNAVTISKIGARFYQQGFQISGSSTSTLDLERAINSNFFNGVEVFVNGLSMINNTAIGDSPANNSDFAVANNGAGSVARITFGDNLVNGDAVMVKYFT